MEFPPVLFSFPNINRKAGRLSLNKMPRNIEIKASVDDLNDVKAKAEDLSGKPGVEINQRDTFFKVGSGRLKLRYLEGTDSELIFYDRNDQQGPKLSDYHIAKTNVPDDLSIVLGKAIGVRGEVIHVLFIFLKSLFMVVKLPLH